jgi:hypothetical protein
VFILPREDGREIAAALAQIYRGIDRQIACDLLSSITGLLASDQGTGRAGT